MAKTHNPGGNSQQRRQFEKAVQKAADNRVAVTTAVEQTTWQKALAFLEHPLFTLPVGIIGGLVGILVSAPVLFVCGACVLLAFHRANVVSKKPIWKVQVPAYFGLVVVVIGLLFLLNRLVDKKLKDANITLSGLIADRLRPTLEPRRAQPEGTTRPKSEYERPQLQQFPIKKGEFYAQIPFAVNGSDARVPLDANEDDPLMLTYSNLGSIADIELLPIPVPNAMHDISDADARAFIGRILQYFDFSSIEEMHNPTVSVNYSTEKGMSVTQPYEVSVPDESTYSLDQVNALLSSLNGNYNWAWRGGFAHWNQRKVTAPRGTRIVFTEEAPLYILQFNNSEFVLSFTNSISNQSTGTLPQHFRLLAWDKPQKLLLFVVKVSYEFKWSGSPNRFDDYSAWAEQLFKGLQRQLVPMHQ